MNVNQILRIKKKRAITPTTDVAFMDLNYAQFLDKLEFE